MILVVRRVIPRVALNSARKIMRKGLYAMGHQSYKMGTNIIHMTIGRRIKLIKLVVTLMGRNRRILNLGSDQPATQRNTDIQIKMGKIVIKVNPHHLS